MDTDMYLDWKVEDTGIQRLKGGRWKSNFLIIEHGSGRLDEKKYSRNFASLLLRIDYYRYRYRYTHAYSLDTSAW
jgi:hypothetical protein